VRAPPNPAVGFDHATCIRDRCNERAITVLAPNGINPPEIVPAQRGGALQSVARHTGEGSREMRPKAIVAGITTALPAVIDYERTRLARMRAQGCTTDDLTGNCANNELGLL